MNETNDLILVLWWIGSMIGVLVFMAFLAAIWEAWDRMNEYDRMKKRGFMSYRDDKGEDWWVGYGD